MSKPVSFAIGSVVVWTRPSQDVLGRPVRPGSPPPNTTFLKVPTKMPEDKRVCVVTDAVLTEDGKMKYSLEGCSWFVHEDLTPLDNPTEASLTYATRIIRDENDSGFADPDSEGEDDDQ